MQRQPRGPIGQSLPSWQQQTPIGVEDVKRQYFLGLQVFWGKRNQSHGEAAPWADPRKSVRYANAAQLDEQA
jgi:hypothetical protein